VGGLFFSEAASARDSRIADDETNGRDPKLLDGHRNDGTAAAEMERREAVNCPEADK
jgi:hypothetical protein